MARPDDTPMLLPLIAAVNAGFTVWFAMNGEVLFAAICVTGVVGPVAALAGRR